MRFILLCSLFLFACASAPSKRDRWFTDGEFEKLFSKERFEDVTLFLKSQPKGSRYEEDVCFGEGKEEHCALVSCDIEDGDTDCWWEAEPGKVRADLAAYEPEKPHEITADPLKLFMDDDFKKIEDELENKKAKPMTKAEQKKFNAEMAKETRERFKPCVKADTSKEVSHCIGKYFDAKSEKEAKLILKRICDKDGVFCLLNNKERVGRKKVRYLNPPFTSVHSSTTTLDDDSSSQKILLYQSNDLSDESAGAQ